MRHPAWHRITIRSIGLFSTLILVRLLAPDDFGIVAMAGASAGLLDMLSGFSFDLALVQAKTPDRSQFDTVWTLNVLRGVGIATITIASAPLMAAIMHEPRIEPVMYVLALAPMLQGFENIALINWQRDLSFDRVFRLNACGKLAGLCLVVPAAVLFGNYWALVVGQIGASIVVLPLGYWLRPYRPRFTLCAWRALFHFSKWLAACNILGVLETMSTVFIIGRLFGSANLGLYQVSTEIGHLPASEVAAPIRRPLYAGYSKVASDLPELRKQFISSFGLILIIFAPLSAGLAVTADSITSLFLGPKWADGTPIVAIFAIGALFENLGYFAHNLYLIRQAQAQFTKIFIVMQLMRIALIIVLGLTCGIVGVAMAIALTAILNCVVWISGALRLLATDWFDLGRVVWRTAVATSTMAASVGLLRELWPAPDAPSLLALQLGSFCLIGAVIHIATQTSLWVSFGGKEAPERLAIDWFRSGFSNLIVSLRIHARKLRGNGINQI